MSEIFPPGSPSRPGPSGRDGGGDLSDSPERHTPPGQAWAPGRHSPGRPRPAEPAPPRRSRPRHRRRPTRRTRLTITCLCTAAIIGLAVALALGPGGGPARHPGPAVTSSPSTPPTAAPGSSTSSTSPHHRPTTTARAAAGTTSTTAASTTTTSAPATTTTTAATPALSPSEVLVEVLNGTGQTGAATAASHALAEQGFRINGTGNAPNFQYRESVVEYPPGALAAAETVAYHVAGATTLEENASLPAGVVDLILGATYDGVTNG